MAWNDNPGGGSGRPRNPWGQGPDRRSPWGQGPDRGPEPPDLDVILRRFQEWLNENVPGLGPGRLAALILLVLLGVWGASGFYTIQPGMNGVVQLFGAWERTEDTEGLHYHLPWPIESVSRINVDEVRRMEIGFRNAGAGARQDKRDLPEESLMLTSDANIIDMDMVVLWNVKSAEDYIFNIDDPENTIKKVAESAIREVVGQTRMFPIITQERGAVADRAKTIMTENLDEYKAGVRITNVLIEEAEVHPDVQDAFQDVQSARQDALDAENRAQAYLQDILPKARGQAIQMRQQAEGYRQSQIAKAQGDAQRFEKVLEAYVTGPEVTRTRLYLETMEKVFGKAQKIILDEKNGGEGVVPYLPLESMRGASGNARQPGNER